MKNGFKIAMGLLLLGVLLGCETVRGVSKDMGNTARNIRDVLGVGRDIGNITK